VVYGLAADYNKKTGEVSERVASSRLIAGGSRVMKWRRDVRGNTTHFIGV